MDIAVITAVYPGVEAYLPVFFESLARQTRRDFRVLIADNGLPDLEAFTRAVPSLEVGTRSYHGSPSHVRIGVIRDALREGYRSLVFCDADDYFAHDRIEAVASLLDRHDIVLNDLTVVDQAGRSTAPSYLSRRLSPFQRIDEAFLWDKNCIGLSNLAVRSDTVRGLELVEGAMAFDWYLAARLLGRAGPTATFFPGTITYYRRHGNSMAPFEFTDDEALLHGLQVKIAHYRMLAPYSESYRTRLIQFRRTQDVLESDTTMLESYMGLVRRRRVESPLWWEEIVSLEEMDGGSAHT